MARLLAKSLFATVVALGMAQVGHAGQSVPALKTNPFSRPLQSQASNVEPVRSEQAGLVPFVLRGTMVAGPQSLANISGVIVPLGKKLNGYKLVAVHQRDVVLLKGDERRILSIDERDEGNGR